jgi:Ca2+-dependent lipid-binding protein
MTKTKAPQTERDLDIKEVDWLLEQETRARILREYYREKFYEKVFCGTLMFWCVAVVAWHVGPYIINTENWPDIMLFFWACLQFLGFMAATLGGLILFAWLATFGRLFDDDFYR